MQYVTVQGRVLGKVIPAGHFGRVADAGLPWTYFAAGGFAESRHGNPIGPSAIELAEGLLIPDLCTFQVLPWDTDMARVFCDHYHRLDDDDRPGAPALSDTRLNLKCLLREFRDDLGLELRSGCEPEMSWFPDKDVAAPGPMLLPGNMGPSYSIAHFEMMRPVIKQVTRYGQALGLDMIQADYEDPGQIEMNFAFGPALTTADRLVTYRQICMQVAKEFGMLATFMPKPVPGIMANGCHHHVSLWQDECPALVVEHGQLNEIAGYATAGLLTHARGMTAIVAPTVNSYARFWEVGLFAPSSPTWGFDNRQGMVRVLPGRLEYRTPDAACNPYLSHAVMGAAIRDGIQNRLSPGPALSATRLHLRTTLGPSLSCPRHWVKRSRRCTGLVVCSAMPDELLRTFIELKTDEWHRACGAVTDWDREMYLHYIP